MKINLRLLVDDPALVDEDDSTGLTEPAFIDLTDGLAALGYVIDYGPTVSDLPDDA